MNNTLIKLLVLLGFAYGVSQMAGGGAKPAPAPKPPEPAPPPKVPIAFSVTAFGNPPASCDVKVLDFAALKVWAANEAEVASPAFQAQGVMQTYQETLESQIPCGVMAVSVPTLPDFLLVAGYLLVAFVERVGFDLNFDLNEARKQWSVFRSAALFRGVSAADVAAIAQRPELSVLL